MNLLSVANLNIPANGHAVAECTDSHAAGTHTVRVVCSCGFVSSHTEPFQLTAGQDRSFFLAGILFQQHMAERTGSSPKETAAFKKLLAAADDLRAHIRFTGPEDSETAAPLEFAGDTVRAAREFDRVRGLF